MNTAPQAERVDAAALAAGQGAFFRTGRTFPIAFRREQLGRLRRMIERGEADLLAALRADLRRPEQEAYVSEIGFVLSEIVYARRHLAAWAAVRGRRTPLIAWPGRSHVRPEPYGVVLIMGPWNYPFQLLFSPLVGALAAGNCACLKPSEYAPRTSAAIARLVRDAFPADYLSVVEGDRRTAEELLAQPFDYVFFTGSAAAGRAVMAAAARRLTPVTLELGGKCPCIVCRDARIAVAARRILWGKCLNAGQTCVAPDFLLVDAQVTGRLVEALGTARRQFFGSSPRESPDFGRIVNQRHFDRLAGYLTDGRIVLGGERDADDLYMAPTVLADVDPASAVMQEEVFGPILPLIEFGSLSDALQIVREMPKPLALYLFTEDRGIVERVIGGTSSGGVCVNDTVTHIFGKDLPFGGVGESGMGTYHGRAGFECFTHFRSVLARSTTVDPPFRYPPASVSLRALKRAYRFLVNR